VIDVLRLTRELIDIPSVTGDEFEIGISLFELLSRRRYHVELQELSGDRRNVLVTGGGAPRVVFATHMDTVPPFMASSEDEEHIYGRGACDAKGIIAAQIAAFERLVADGFEGLGLLFTVDEEVTSAGAKLANDHPWAASCEYLINGEPTDNRLAIGTKGSLQALVKTAGRAAHSAYPEAGESAIEKLLDVLDDIRAIDWPGDEVFGETTCNIGVLAGGTRANIIASEAEARLLIRLAVSAGVIKERLAEAIDGRAEIEFKSGHDPVRLLAFEGFEQMLARFTTDIPYLSNWGQPMLIGPGSILAAHTDNERVAKAELLKAVDLYIDLASRL
jgi:acetylornithine deacetylase